MQFDFSAFADEAESMPLKVLTQDGQVLRPDLGDGDMVNAFVAELSEAVAALDNNQTTSILDGQLARDAIALCDAQTRSVKSGHSEPP